MVLCFCSVSQFGAPVGDNPEIFGIRKLESLGHHLALFADLEFSNFGTVPACDGQTRRQHIPRYHSIASRGKKLMQLCIKCCLLVYRAQSAINPEQMSDRSNVAKGPRGCKWIRTILTHLICGFVDPKVIWMSSAVFAQHVRDQHRQTYRYHVTCDIFSNRPHLLHCMHAMRPENEANYTWIIESSVTFSAWWVLWSRSQNSRLQIIKYT